MEQTACNTGEYFEHIVGVSAIIITIPIAVAIANCECDLYI